MYQYKKALTKKASPPLVEATTSLIKRALSYRWTITDAIIILEDFPTYSYESTGLMSPAFSITVPLRTESAGLQEKVVWWYLNFNKYTHTYSVPNPNARYGWGQPATITKSEDYLSISLWQDKYRNEEVIDCRSSYYIHMFDFVFSVIQPNTEEVLWKKSFERCMGCDINKANFPQRTELYVDKMFLCNDMDKFLCDGALTVQVNAILKFFMDPMETLTLHTERLPLDNIFTGMKKLLSDGLLADLTIKCGDSEFKAHKAILASQSPVFRRMLESDMKEQRTNVIEISDVDQAVISDMLAYIYTGSAPNLDTLARELLNVANKYELSGLFTMCERELKLKINLENVIELLQLADMLDSSYLKKSCLNYISFNSGAIRSSEEWKQLKEKCEGHVSVLMDIADCMLKC